MHRVFQWQRLQRLVVPQDKTLKAMSLRSRESVSHNNGKRPSHLSHLPAVLRRQLSACFLSFVVRGTFSYTGVHLRSPTLSSALSNMETIGGTSQETRRTLEEDPAIEKCSRSREVNGAVHRPCTGKERFATALPGNYAEPPSNFL